MNKMNPVVYFEMPYEDSDRVAKFSAECRARISQMISQELGSMPLSKTLKAIVWECFNQ